MELRTPLSRRTFIAASGSAAVLPREVAATAGAVSEPEQFGAKGDGRTNDTAAFARLSEQVNRQGGGTISLRSGKTYLVGMQERGIAVGWVPSPILDLHHLAKPLRIIGNGARLQCQPGLRFGTFDRSSGLPVQRAMPNLRREERASPYRAMVLVRHCSAAIEIYNLELDGNVERLSIGGRYGDKGWQIPATGLILEENTGPETVVNVLSHHHGRDGVMINGAARRHGRSRLSRLLCRYNGRQGVSVTAGSGYDFADCDFSHTGRSAIRSAPGAGVDIEAEGGRPIRDLSFIRCRFINNAGVGLVADSGNSEGAQFTDCLFVGTTSWSAWPRKPRFSFGRCTFVGSVVHAFPSPDSAQAAQFVDCLFTDDPSKSPTGQVYLHSGPIVNLAKSDNVLFDRCIFRLSAGGILPSTATAIYRDCAMIQASPRMGKPKGRYLGRSVISGNVNLSGAIVEGEVILNGRRLTASGGGLSEHQTENGQTRRDSAEAHGRH